MTEPIQIQINGKSHLLNQAVFLDALLQEFKINPQYVAVALNDEVLPKKELAGKMVQNGDRIEIIRAVAGG